MSRGIFSPEELAELAAFDREIEDDDEPLTLEEWRASMRRDRGLEGPPKPYSDERRARQREQSKAYRAAHREKAVAAHREWYANNRAYAQAWQRDYNRRHAVNKRESLQRLQERNRDSEARLQLRKLRKALGLTQAELGEIFDRSRQVVHHWESGKSNIPAAVLEWMGAQRDQMTI